MAKQTKVKQRQTAIDFFGDQLFSAIDFFGNRLFRRSTFFGDRLFRRSTFSAIDFFRLHPAHGLQAKLEHHKHLELRRK